MMDLAQSSDILILAFESNTSDAKQFAGEALPEKKKERGATQRLTQKLNR